MLISSKTLTNLYYGFVLRMKDDPIHPFTPDTIRPFSFFTSNERPSSVVHDDIGSTKKCGNSVTLIFFSFEPFLSIAVDAFIPNSFR